jgi:hypothetical protein
VETGVGVGALRWVQACGDQAAVRLRQAERGDGWYRMGWVWLRSLGAKGTSGDGLHHESSGSRVASRAHARSNREGVGTSETSFTRQEHGVA